MTDHIVIHKRGPYGRMIRRRLEIVRYTVQTVGPTIVEVEAGHGQRLLDYDNRVFARKHKP